MTFPLVFWGVAWLGDLALRPWGSILVAVFHAVFGTSLVVSIIRDNRAAREIDGST